MSDFVQRVRAVVETVSPEEIAAEEVLDVFTEFVRGAAKALMLKSSVLAATPSHDDSPMSPKEAAQYIRLSYHSLLHAARAGQIEGEHPSPDRWAFRRSALDRYLKKQKIRYSR
jgi:hypothetical protein